MCLSLPWLWKVTAHATYCKSWVVNKTHGRTIRNVIGSIDGDIQLYNHKLLITAEPKKQETNITDNYKYPTVEILAPHQGLTVFLRR